MFEQFQKGVSKVETGLFEYVAKKQAANVISQIDKPKDNNDIGYFDKLKRKLFNNEEQAQQQQSSTTQNQKVNQNSNNNNNNNNQQWQQQQDKGQQDGIQNERQPGLQQESEISKKLREKLGISAKSGEQFREVQNEVSKKAKQVASDIGDQFYKLIGKKPVDNKLPERTDSGQQSQQQQQNGWIVEDNNNNKNNNWRIDEQEEEKEMKQNYRQIQRSDNQQSQRVTQSGNPGQKGQTQQQLDLNNQRDNSFNNNSGNTSLNKDGIKRLSQNRIFRKIEDDSSSESDSSLNSPYIQAPGQKLGWQAQNESFENNYQRTNMNRNNNGQQQSQQDRSPLSRKKIFEQGSDGVNRQEVVGKQDFNRNYSQNSQRFLKQGQNQNESYENYANQQDNQFNQQRFNRNQSLNGSYNNMSGLNNSQNYQYQQGGYSEQSQQRQDYGQNSQISNNISRNQSQMDIIQAMMNYSNQNGSYYQEQEQQNVNNNNKLDQIYYESDDFGAVLSYELNMAMETITQRRLLTQNEKRERYLLGLDNMVCRVENLREYQRDIEDKIGQSVNQNQLQNGIYQMLQLADTTDQTTGKIQRIRVKLANYKALHIQRSQQIQKLSKSSKKLSVFISFITKIQSKYSDLILFSSVSINSQLLYQFPSILETLHSLSTSSLAESSSGLKLLKAIQHAAISNANKIQAIFTIIQDIFIKDIFRPRQINNILDIHRYSSIIRAYFTLTQKFPKQFSSLNVILKDSVKSAVVSIQTDQINIAYQKISKQQTLSASIRVNTQNQQKQQQYRFTNIPVNMFCDSLSIVFHEITLLLMAIDQIQSIHVKSLMYPKEILDFHEQETSQLKQQVTNIITEQLSDIIQSADWNELTNQGMTERLIVLISQFMVVLREFNGIAPNEITNILKTQLIKQLQITAKQLNTNLRKAVKQDNWVNQQLDEEYLQKLVFQLRKNQNEQTKRIFSLGVSSNNKNLSNTYTTNVNNNLASSQQIPNILANYRINQVFATVTQPRQLTQIEMKQPDAPVEDLDSSLTSFNQKSNLIQQQSNIQTSLIRDAYSFNNMNYNNNHKDIPLFKPLQGSISSSNTQSISQTNQQRTPLLYCSSSLSVVESLFKLFQLVQVMTPIAYEVLLEAQKFTEEYIYQISCLFIRKTTRDFLSDSLEDLATLPSMPPSILEQERLIQSLEQVHFKAIQSSRFPNLKRIFIKISSNTEQKSDTESRITNQFMSFKNNNTNNGSDFSNPTNKGKNHNNNNPGDNILFCGMPALDLNIFTMSRAEKQQQQSSSFRPSFSGSDNLLVMMEFDLRQRLSAKESMQIIIKFMSMAESTLFHQLSLIDTAISAQQFTRKIFNEELAAGFKELGLLIVKDYIDNQIQKERLFSDFDTNNWKPAEYYIEVTKPIYIDNSLFFIKEILREQQKYQQSIQGCIQPQNLFFQELLMECWHNQFREIIAQVRKFSDKGRTKLMQHFQQLKMQTEQIIFETQNYNNSNYPQQSQTLNQQLLTNDRYIQSGVQFYNNNLSLSNISAKESLQNISQMTEQFIQIQNTNSVSDLLEFILKCKDQIPLSVLLSIIRSSDRLVLFLSSQKYYDTLLSRIYTEFHIFSQNSQLK